MAKTESETKLMQIIDGLRENKLSEHAHMIGVLCIAWSRIELGLNSLLWETMDGTSEKARAIVIATMDFRDKVRALVPLGFDQKPNDEWYGTLTTTLNIIDNELRPERNRMVHDSWHTLDEKVYRFTQQAKVYNEQAKKLALKLYEGKPVTPPEIMALAIRCYAETGKLMNLALALEKSRPPIASLEKSR